MTDYNRATGDPASPEQSEQPLRDSRPSVSNLLWHDLHAFCWCQPRVETDLVTGGHLIIHRRSLDSLHIEDRTMIDYMTAPGSEVALAVTPALSPRELEALTAYARTGHQQQAAHLLGISIETLKNYLTRAYAKLDADGALNAFRAMGWLRVPLEVNRG
jgi:DNA-binding CsgD family transcriptional regulator